MLRAEHCTQPTKACDDLIRDQKDIVLVQNSLDCGPVTGRWRHNPARAQRRLANEGRDGVSPFAGNQIFQLCHAMRHELCLALVKIGAAEIVRGFCVHDLRQRQIEFGVEQPQPGQRSGHQTRAVIAAPPRDDFLFLGPPQYVVVVPDQLDVGFICVRTGQPEIHLRHIVRRTVQNHLGQCDRRLGTVTDIGMIVGQLFGLIGDGLCNLGAAVTYVNAIEPRKGIQHPVPVTILDMAA